MSQNYLKKIKTQTFSMFYNPTCAKPYLIHLVNEDKLGLDNLNAVETKDVLGYGQTMEEAAKNVWQKKFGNKK